MASIVTIPLPAERFFRISLFFVVLISVTTLSITGKLDPITTVLAPALVLYKGFRWWRGFPTELKSTTATRLVLGYLLLFPVDALFVSRQLAAGIPDPALYAIVLAAVHFLIFVTIVRLYSATTDRDALFLAMLSFACLLGAAIFTVDTYFLVFFVAFLIFAVATFVGLEIRRGASNSIYPEMEAQPARARRFYRALGLASLTVAIGGILLGSVFFFFLPALQCRISLSGRHAVHVDEWVYRQR